MTAGYSFLHRDDGMGDESINSTAEAGVRLLIMIVMMALG